MTPEEIQIEQDRLIALKIFEQEKQNVATSRERPEDVTPDFRSGLSGQKGLHSAKAKNRIKNKSDRSYVSTGLSSHTALTAFKRDRPTLDPEQVEAIEKEAKADAKEYAESAARKVDLRSGRSGVRGLHSAKSTDSSDRSSRSSYSTGRSGHGGLTPVR
eukprot:CAMPEP_0172491086 /NCGR_PEP_ID=MMETSP1066-20121228/21778_1 /TAXON_ID=671091 /ORGANISM="Coscinodiscus wailesii, Strain CCMP2513" /LENGTH=158 /DNA_ID=CAMNT_0013259933 /DNA_START=119 /DNA_END=595 /DNA_ORIENTATION=+